jgi:hypothetical protein
MIFKLEIDLSTDAFKSLTGFELARILRAVANSVDYQAGYDLAGREGPVRDVNGNVVGRLSILEFAQPTLVDKLTEARDYIDGYVDVRDAEGQPVPNNAMRAAQLIDEALRLLKGQQTDAELERKHLNYLDSRTDCGK